MPFPKLLFGSLGFLSAFAAFLVFLLKRERYNSAVKTCGVILGGYWITNKRPGTTDERVWVATVGYRDQNHTERTFTPQFGLSPTQKGETVPILLFPDGSAMLDGFREKWIWVILLAIPGVAFGPWMFLG